jgi:hypothetical protein
LFQSVEDEHGGAGVGICGGFVFVDGGGSVAGGQELEELGAQRICDLCGEIFVVGAIGGAGAKVGDGFFGGAGLIGEPAAVLADQVENNRAAVVPLW